MDGTIDEVAVFKMLLKGADVKSIMNKGLKSWLGGVAAIDPSGKLTATWVGIKAQ